MLVTNDLVLRVLTAFLAIAQKDSNKFSPKDVEMVRTNKWWVQRYILISKTEVEATEGLIKCMEWRNLNGVNEFNDEYFLDVIEPSIIRIFETSLTKFLLFRNNIRWLQRYCRSTSDLGPPLALHIIWFNNKVKTISCLSIRKMW